jgi:hypothetical protein
MRNEIPIAIALLFLTACTGETVPGSTATADAGLLKCSTSLAALCCTPDPNCSGCAPPLPCLEEWSQASTCNSIPKGSALLPPCSGYNALGNDTDVQQVWVYDPSGHVTAYIVRGGTDPFSCTAGPATLDVPPSCLQQWENGTGNEPPCFDAGSNPDGDVSATTYCEAIDAGPLLDAPME